MQQKFDIQLMRELRSSEQKPPTHNTLKNSAPWPKPPNEAAYHGLVGDFVRIIEPQSETDPVALLVQFLLAFGNAMGRNAYFMVEATHHYLNEFSVTVGESSRSRKGTSLGHVEKIFETADPNWIDSCRHPGGLSSGEGLIWAVRDPIIKLTDENSRDSISDEGVSDKRLLVVEEEFASALRVMSRDGNTLSPTIRRAWDKGTLRSLTKNSPARATGAHISILGHITRDELLRYFDKTEIANGFGNRFLWVCVKRSKLLPEGGRVDMDKFQPIIQRLVKAVQFSQKATELKRDEDTREIWRGVYPKLTRDVPGLLGAVTSRGEAHVVRLSCIYALLDMSYVVRPEHLNAALALWSYCEESAKHIFGEALGYPLADDILKALRAAGPQGLTRSDILHGLFKRNRNSWEIGAALEFLESNGLAKRVVEATSGRPAERWFAR